MTSMTPDIPEVSLPAWKSLYQSAQRVYSFQPWTVLDDTQLIGVRDSSTGEIGYACFMGCGGALFGLCFYRGAEGFESYTRLMSREIEPESVDNLFVQNCLKLELGPKSNLEKEDMAVVKKLGLVFKGKKAWPQFRSLLPGYYPWLLDENEARFLTVGLNGACHHFELVLARKVKESMKEGEVLVYTRTNEGFTSVWESWPIHRPPPLPPMELDYVRVRTALAKVTKPDSSWEAGTFYTPSPVCDGGRPFFSKMALVNQASSGFVFDTHLFGPMENEVQSMSNVILGAIEKHGFLPSEIRFSNGALMSNLTPLSVALGVRFVQMKTLSAFENAKTAFIDFCSQR